MIKKIRISGFRSVENAEVDLAPLTVLYGPTASGKSSLLYALLVLKNFILSPTQQADGFFNLGFMNLGGFDDCVFNKDKEKSIDISYSLSDGEYGFFLRKDSADLFLKSKIQEMKAKVSIPYPMNQNFTFIIKEDDSEYTINWNGINANVIPKQPIAETQQKAADIAQKLNWVCECVKKIDIAPHKRGFFKPNYSPSQVGQTPTSEDEVATIIINDPNLSPRISVDLESILNRDFRTYTPPGTATVFFQTTDKNSRIPTYLVNDGFGVNQIVYMLAKIHRPEIKTVLIEEPEVHLHPSMVRALVRTLCSIVKEEKKQIILTTHNEVFVFSLLSAVRRKDISPDEVKCYLAKKEKRATKFEEQKVNETGEIEGGLSSFMEGELEDLKVFFEKT